MRHFYSTLMVPAAVALSFVASAAVAHPKLVSSTPADKATVRAPKSITMQFSEKLVAPMTGATLTMTGMPGMAHPPMRITAFAKSIAGDGKTLVLALERPLAPGSYAVNWYAVAADTHRIQGSFTFTVK